MLGTDTFKEMKNDHCVWQAQRCEMEAGQVGRSEVMHGLVDRVRELDLYSKAHKKPLQDFHSGDKEGDEMINCAF